jgi:hypothetical protein
MRRFTSRHRLLSSSTIAIALLAIALSAQTPQKGAGPGATAAEGTNYTKYAAGLYTRRVSQTVGPSKDYGIEEWGLLVGPGQNTDTVTLPGAAVLVVRTGTATLIIDGQKQQVRLGSSVLIAEKQRFSIMNADKERPVSIKAVIVRGL